LQSNAKEAPPVWSPDARQIYFTAGRKPDDLWRGRPSYGESGEPAFRLMLLPFCTYRVDVATSEIEKVALGHVASIAPDGSYVLLDAHPVALSEDNDEYRTAKLDLATREITLLPKGIYNPRVSPSGQYVACVSGPRKVKFLRTSDWKQQGPEIEVDWGCETWKWFRFRWITPGRDATTQPTGEK
jgi:hypothetical protein